MAKRDSFLIRLDPRVLDAIRRWSDDEMRSVNAQIEFILRESLRASGRLVPKPEGSENPEREDGNGNQPR